MLVCAASVPGAPVVAGVLVDHAKASIAVHAIPPDKDKVGQPTARGQRVTQSSSLGG
jgi:hypothetical protein